MKEIIFATKNKGKIKEIQAILGHNYIVKSIEDIGIDIDIVEDGKTFEENAIKKAVEIMKITNKIVLADDSGLEIDYLNGEPGVYSARYMGEDTPYEIKNAKILEMLKDVEEEKRGARFVSVIALAIPGKKPITTRGTIEGIIAYEMKGENGFGYDPIFYIPELKKTAAELSLEEKNKISHRGKALSEMKKILLYRKVLVFSDSHGNIDNMVKVIENFDKDVFAIIHLGDYADDVEDELRNLYTDKLFYSIAGNNDFISSVAQDEEIIEINGHKVFLTHGHQYNVYFGIDKLYYKLNELGINIGLYGHTHRPSAFFENNTLILNPGSISSPRGSSICTFLLMDFLDEVTYKFYGIFKDGIKEIDC